MKVIPKKDMFTHYKELLLKKDKEYKLNEYQEHNTHWGKVKSYYVIDERGKKYLMGTFEDSSFWMDHENKKINYEMIKDNHRFNETFTLTR